MADKPAPKIGTIADLHKHGFRLKEYERKEPVMAVYVGAVELPMGSGSTVCEDAYLVVEDGKLCMSPRGDFESKYQRRRKK